MCLRHKFGKIENRYQYCLKCGKSIPVKHEHIWVLTKEINYTYDINAIPLRMDNVYHCSICGEPKVVKIAGN